MHGEQLTSSSAKVCPICVTTHHLTFAKRKKKKLGAIFIVAKKGAIEWHSDYSQGAVHVQCSTGTFHAEWLLNMAIKNPQSIS